MSKPSSKKSKKAKRESSAPLPAEPPPTPHERPGFEEGGPIANEPFEWPAPTPTGAQEYDVVVPPRNR